MGFIKIKIATVFFVILALCSCEKEDTAVILPPRPNALISLLQVGLGENYEDQVYVNFLDSNYEKARVKNNIWDLAFDCKMGSNRVMINGGKGVLLSILGKRDFKSNIKLSDLKWRWDEASGGDSIVLKNWFNEGLVQTNDSVYLIDRGIGSIGGRFYQFKLNKTFDGHYKIIVADLYGKILKVDEVRRAPAKNQVYYDFGSVSCLNFEPNNDNWQFCFLKCRWIYYEFNPPLLYTVTGVHINPKTVSLAIDSSLNFESIKLGEVFGLTYKEQRDAIGFEWKLYDFNQGRYTTRKYVNYIFRTKGPHPVYYKLRFTDYYNKQGVKGSPRFEVSVIN
ncbi:MAG: HmuY family protein [bacterium]|nr:HmuY family protein [bacterium]